MPKKTKTKTKRVKGRVSNKTLKNAIRIVIDNSKKSVRVNSSKTPKTISQPTIQPSISQNLSNLERSIYENEIARLNRNSLMSFVNPNNMRPTGTTLNMNQATQTPPDPQLSPATMTNVGLERMRQYLIDNRNRIPTSKSYTVEEIERLQPNRISQMYADTRQNILNAPQTPSQGPSSRFFGSGLFGGSSQK